MLAHPELLQGVVQVVLPFEAERIEVQVAREFRQLHPLPVVLVVAQLIAEMMVTMMMVMVAVTHCVPVSIPFEEATVPMVPSVPSWMMAWVVEQMIEAK